MLKSVSIAIAFIGLAFFTAAVGAVFLDPDPTTHLALILQLSAVAGCSALLSLAFASIALLCWFMQPVEENQCLNEVVKS